MSERNSLSIQLFGQFQVSASGRMLAIPSEKVRSLFAYAALRPGEPIPRNELMAALWPDKDETTARPRLRRVIWKLRRLLHPFHSSLRIETTQTTMRLACLPDAVDAVKFKRLLTTSGEDLETLRDAVDLYEGELLAGAADEWVDRDRFHYQALFLRAIKYLVTLLISQQDGTTALLYARRAVELDHTDEEAAYALMQAAVLAGEPAMALSQYDIFSRSLKDDIGIAPSAHIAALFERIRATSLRGPPLVHTVDLGDSSVAGPTADVVALTGRSVEHEKLLHALRLTLTGRSASVVVTGPAGAGKSRLAEAISADAQLMSIPVYKGHCSDVPNPPSYHPIVEALWSRLSPAASEQSPALAALLSTLAPRKGQRRNNFPTVASTFDAALISESLLRILPAPDEPVALLVVDDVHRADHATWVWLNSLVGRLRDLRVCVVLTARTGEVQDQDQRVAQLADAGSEVIALEPLDADGIKALVSAALGIPRAPGSLWRPMSRYVGGNPLHILEAIRLLRDRGLLRRSEDSWTVDPQTSEELAAFASSQVSALFQHRIALLPEASRNVLAAAAVFGMEIGAEQLRRLMELTQQRFLSHVERLIRHRLLVSRADATLRLPHEEIRKTVLDQINPVRRRWLHGRAAHILSRAESTRPEDLYWHYHGAGNLTGALSAASAAGDGSYAVGEHSSAIAWYDRALAALASITQIYDSRTRLALELKLEAALNQHGDRPRQLFVLESVEEVAMKASYRDELCEALIRRSLCLTRLNRRDAAIDAAEQAADLAHRMPDLHREARAYRAMGAAHENFGDAEVVRFLSKALRIFRQIGSVGEESVTLSELATAYDRLGKHTAAVQALDRAAALLPPDDRSRALLLARRAGAFLWTGRLSETYAAVQESLRLVHRFGDRIGEGRALRVLADAHTIAGRYRDALVADGHGLQIAKNANDARLVAGILNSLIGGIYSRLGLIHRARSAFDHLMQLVGNDPQESYRALSEDSLSTVYLQVGDWEEARVWAERALTTGAVIGREWYASAEAHLHLGHALLELHDPTGAQQQILASLAYHRSSGELPYQAFETALMAVAAIDLGNQAEAQEYLRDSLRILHRIDILQDAHLLRWLHGHVWSRMGAKRQAARAFRAAYAELNRVAASLGGPLRRRFLSLPFQRRVLEAVGVNPPSALVAKANFGPLPLFVPPESSGIQSLPTRRQAVLRALTDSAKKPTRRALAAALGVTPRTITNDIAALRRAGHQIETPRITH